MTQPKLRNASVAASIAKTPRGQSESRYRQDAYLVAHPAAGVVNTFPGAAHGGIEDTVCVEAELARLYRIETGIGRSGECEHQIATEVDFSVLGPADFASQSAELPGIFGDF